VIVRRADALLVAACFLWGVSFVIVKDALASATPLAFVAMRFGLAAVAFAPFAGLKGGFAPGELKAGALLALLLGAGFLAQTAGLVYTTPSRSAFIVGVSSILAPPIALLTLRERARPAMIVALVIATIGIWLLTNPDAGGLNKGDLLTFITAVAFGGQIVAISAIAPRFALVRLLWLQIAGTALLAALATPLVETVRVAWSPAFVAAVLFTALGATVAALFLQLRAQREMSSARAAVIFCSETLFAALTSWIVLGERMTAGQWLGGALILGGMLLTAVPERQPPG
jgi:drug/metabolite transporter (DMT)-like permease